jgi:hypothetical protein
MKAISQFVESERQTMEVEKPQERQITLTCTSEEAAALLAASSRYIIYAKRHPELGLQIAIPLLEEVQRRLVEQARGRAQACHN